MWDEGTSCYNPYGEEDIGDNIDEANFDDYYPSDLGDIVHYYGNQYVPVLSDDVDSDGKYYIKYLRLVVGEFSARLPSASCCFPLLPVSPACL